MTACRGRCATGWIGGAVVVVVEAVIDIVDVVTVFGGVWGAVVWEQLRTSSHSSMTGTTM
jgi:hypothetical protein